MIRKDIDFNFAIHPLTGDLALKTDKTAIQQSIKNLVLTEFYDRGFNVEVGSNVTDSLFDNFTPLMNQTIKNNIIRVLKNFEPEVEVVDVTSDMITSNELTVVIAYNIVNDVTIRTTQLTLRRLR